jgi:RNA recognition motif-containing protein
MADPQPLSVWVSNIPPNWDERSVRGIFDEFGPITRVDLPESRYGVRRPYVYVHYGSAEDCEKAISGAHGRLVAGRRLDVRRGKAAPPRGRDPAPRGAPPEYRDARRAPRGSGRLPPPYREYAPPRPPYDSPRPPDLPGRAPYDDRRPPYDLPRDLPYDLLYDLPRDLPYDRARDLYDLLRDPYRELRAAYEQGRHEGGRAFGRRPPGAEPSPDPFGYLPR